MNIDSTGFFSYVFSSWLTNYLWKAYRKGIQLSDLPPTSPLDSCSCNAPKFENLWNDELRLRGPTSASLSLVAWRFVRFRVLISCVLNVGSQIVNFTMQTVLLRHFLEFHEKVEDNFFWGMHWVVYIVGFDLLQMILHTWGDIMNKRTALRLRSVCLSLLFKKVVHLNNVNFDNTKKLVEMLTEDGQKIFQAVDSAASIIVAPTVALCVVICSSLWLNSLAVFGLLLFLAFYVIQYWLVHLLNYCQQNVDGFTKERMQKTIEIMNNIKLIKINAWEQHFVQNVSNIRNKEGKWLWKLSYVKSLNSSAMDALPVIAIVMMFFLHGTVSYDLKVSIIFPICVVIMVQMQGAFRSIKPSISRLKESLEIFRRIKAGLLMDDTSCHITKPYEPSQAVAIVNGTFVFDVRQKLSAVEEKKKLTKEQYIEKNASENEKEKLKPASFEPKRIEILSNITLKAKKGQLIGICGKASSGKSSLLLAALGQIKMTNGQLMRQGSCAYVGQQAWLANGSIKQNILFEEAYDAKRYYEAQVVCQLRQDMRTLPEADETEVGDGGVDVTESFRQRIALARAFYADRDIYFLDDPLSCMEDRTSREIFEDLIIRALAEKTILLVTPDLEYLDRCDYMYIMRDGKIAEHGRHKDLMRLGREYASMVKAANDDAEDGYVDDPSDGEEEIYVPQRRQSVINIEFPLNKKSEDDDEDDDKSVAPEIKPKNYQVYTKFIGNYILIFSVIISYLMYSGIQVFSLWRLAVWIEFTRKNSILLLTDKEYLFSYYQHWFGFCFVLVIVGCIVQSLVVQYAAVKIGSNVHTELINKFVHSPLKIFDFSSKRMKALFSRDLHDISLQLPLKLDSTLRYIALSLSTFFVLISTIPWFSNYVVFTTPIIYFIGKMYIIGCNNFKHLEHEIKLRTNMFLENSMRGLSTIRTFQKESDMLSKFQNIVDVNSACCFIKGLSERWLSIRLQLMSTAFLLVAATVIIILEKDICPAIAGLTFVYILMIPHVVRLGMRYLVKTESSLHSVQRVYSTAELLTDEVNDKVVTAVADVEWPTTGSIEFDKAVLKRNENDKDEVVLDSVSFSVGDGEKIGVLNVSDSGGNGLIIALYRLYELNSGSISIDNVDLSKIAIKLLRSRLSIVPQDPIFYGTIRFFLDPEKRQSDAELWNSLEKVHMKDRIAACASQLHYTIDAKTFNVIEKQLLYLARAFLSKNKILVLEECEAPESLAGLVLQVIEKEFTETTLLVITRRLRTVLSCDRVLVMDSNRALEFDKPSALLADANSTLKKTMIKIDEMSRRM